MENQKKNRLDKTLQKPLVMGALALLCCLLWGSAIPCVKLGYDWQGIESTGSQILYAGYRFFLSGVFTFLIGSAVEKRVLTIKKSSIPYIMNQGLLQTTGQYLFYYIGIGRVSGAKSSVINSMQSFIAIIAAHFLIKDEKMTWKKAAACIVGFSGAVIVNLEAGAWEGGFSLMGEGMLLLAATFYGVSSVIIKLISHLESIMAITAYQLMFGGFLLIVIGWIAGGQVFWPDAKSVVLFIYLALLSTVSFSLWALLIKYNPVWKVSIFGFSIPIFGMLLSALLLGEQPWSFKNLAALVCVSAGIVMANGRETKEEKP